MKLDTDIIVVTSQFKDMMQVVTFVVTCLFTVAQGVISISNYVTKRREKKLKDDYIARMRMTSLKIKKK